MNVASIFRQQFHQDPQTCARAQARVNLLGDHTDYNGGLALPSLLPQYIEVALSATTSSSIEAYSSEFGGGQRSLLAAGQQGDWLDFALGCARLFAAAAKVEIAGLQIAVSSNIVSGSGISSSAALELALLRALRQLYSSSLEASSLEASSLSDQQLAHLGQRVEHEYVGLQCGLLDQLAVSCARLGEALLINFADLSQRAIKIHPEFKFVVIHSGSSRRLGASAYNQRRASCEAAARRFNIASISMIKAQQIEQLDPPSAALARHVSGENQRVLAAAAALESGDIAAMAAAMNASHISLRDLYQVSSEALEACRAAALASGALAARLTGAGFGGCIVALVPRGQSLNGNVLAEF